MALNETASLLLTNLNDINASGRRVTVSFSSDPDIAVTEKLTTSVTNKLAVEIKGGTDVTNVHNATVILDKDPALIYVGEDRFLAKLESYFGLSSALRERVSDIDYVDLRVDDRIFVRPVTRTKTFGVAPVGGQLRATRANTKKR